MEHVESLESIAGELPLLVEFSPGSRVERACAVVSDLPVLQNGPPGTFVVFADGARIPLPTDRIVYTVVEDGGAARVGFEGIQYGGTEAGSLVFHRVQDLQPKRGRTMTLEPHRVSFVLSRGRRAWPAGPCC